MCALVQCSSGSSLRRLGGTVVIRILTVASAELISKPVSLVSMDSTESNKCTQSAACHRYTTIAMLHFQLTVGHMISDHLVTKTL